jgi:hypothetical protein
MNNTDNLFKHNKKIMFVSTNAHLSNAVAETFKKLAEKYNFDRAMANIIIANKDSTIILDDIRKKYYQFKPDIIVFDPVGIGHYSHIDLIYYDGLRLANEFDQLAGQNKDFEQIVWTMLLPADLPLLENSFYLNQDTNLNDIFSDLWPPTEEFGHDDKLTVRQQEKNLASLLNLINSLLKLQL